MKVLRSHLRRTQGQCRAPDGGRRIDVDAPFDRYEVAEATGEAYARSLGSSDMPVVEIAANESLEGFCEVGAMACDISKN